MKYPVIALLLIALTGCSQPLDLTGTYTGTITPIIGGDTPRAVTVTVTRDTTYTARIQLGTSVHVLPCRTHQELLSCTPDQSNYEDDSWAGNVVDGEWSGTFLFTSGDRISLGGEFNVSLTS